MPVVVCMNAFPRGEPQGARGKESLAERHQQWPGRQHYTATLRATCAAGHPQVASPAGGRAVVTGARAEEGAALL